MVKQASKNENIVADIVGNLAQSLEDLGINGGDIIGGMAYVLARALGHSELPDDDLAAWMERFVDYIQEHRTGMCQHKTDGTH